MRQSQQYDIVWLVQCFPKWVAAPLWWAQSHVG